MEEEKATGLKKVPETVTKVIKHGILKPVGSLGFYLQSAGHTTNLNVPVRYGFNKLNTFKQFITSSVKEGYEDSISRSCRRKFLNVMLSAELGTEEEMQLGVAKVKEQMSEMGMRSELIHKVAQEVKTECEEQLGDPEYVVA